METIQRGTIPSVMETIQPRIILHGIIPSVMETIQRGTIPSVMEIIQHG